jgi:hypothetical protein
MAQATDSLTTTHTTCNPTDPVQALATCWSTIHEIDRAQRELDQREKAAHAQKDCLEQAVLALEPQSASDALSMLLLVLDHLQPNDGQQRLARALQAIAGWLVRSGGESRFVGWPEQNVREWKEASPTLPG